MGERAGRPAGPGTGKVTASHRSRDAIIYVRQSTFTQTQENTESLALQYELRRYATELGWGEDQISVIDDDLARSASSTDGRLGFTDLVAAVGLGRAGIIVGREVSRLARNNTDWYQVLDLCSITDTLIADVDGIYHPGDFNDRLVLGLKGQMAEAELHMLRMRLTAALRHKAARGELRQLLPVGLDYDDDGQVMLSPDEAVRSAISQVYALFGRLGSARQVMMTLREQGLRLPRRKAGARRITWAEASYPAVHDFLTNPAYAGAFAFGKTTTRTEIAGGKKITRHRQLPQDQWEVLIPGHHPGYITWEEYLANEAKLAANRTNAGARPPREGTALCQGIVFCGACGRSMQVRYQDRLPRYECGHSRADHVATPLCGSVRADTIDAVAAGALLAAVAPDQVALALAAAGEVTDRHRRSVRAAELAAERARYAADRAERAFLACEPENRLVARTLEARWEARLTDLAEAEAALAVQAQARPELPGPDQLAATIADLPALWAAPTTSDRDRKRLLRALLADVTLTPSASDPTQILVGLRWKSGASQQVQVTRRKNAYQLRSTDPAAIELARRIGPGLDNNTLAGALNDAGHRTVTGQPFDGVAAGNLRSYHHIPYPGLLEDGEMTPRQVAQLIGVSTGTIHYWINAGYLTARRGPAGRWCIPFPPDVEAACRERAAGSAHQHRDTDPAPRREHELSIADAARRLGVKPDVIYNWAQWGHIPARRGDAGRLWIDFTPAVERACLERIASSYKLPDDIRTQAAQRLERNAV